MAILKGFFHHHHTQHKQNKQLCFCYYKPQTTIYCLNQIVTKVSLSLSLSKMDKVEVYVKKVDDYIAQYPSVTQYGMFFFICMRTLHSFWLDPSPFFIFYVQKHVQISRIKMTATPTPKNLIRVNNTVQRLIQSFVLVKRTRQIIDM